MIPRKIGLFIVAFLTSLVADFLTNLATPGVTGTSAFVSTFVGLAVVALLLGRISEQFVDYGNFPWVSAAVIAGVVSGLRLVMVGLIGVGASGPLYWVFAIVASIATVVIIEMLSGAVPSLPPTTTTRRPI